MAQKNPFFGRKTLMRLKFGMKKPFYIKNKNKIFTKSKIFNTVLML